MLIVRSSQLISSSYKYIGHDVFKGKSHLLGVKRYRIKTKINFNTSASFKNAQPSESRDSAKKKDVSDPYPMAYIPKDVEKGWYEYWENSRLFLPKTQPKDQPVFSIVLPPPNVTGNLHLGHTLTATIQDAICRWRRMKGESVVWIPGYDHGGIATQAVVEKKVLKEKKLKKHQLGRESFLQEVEQWRTSTQATIEDQLRKIGSSLDFTRSSFTMDSHSSDAVVQAFVRLFNEKLIYRKLKMVNWSCTIRSVISDIEVDHLEVPAGGKLRVPGLEKPVDVGLLDYFYYPIHNSDEKVLVATTRLETMLGDVALAINPNDPRYCHLAGKFVMHPFTGNQIPIIADETVDKEFGSGVVKITPAHDFKDFLIGSKHELPLNEILEDDGNIKNHIDIFGGIHRLEARQLVRQHLESRGLFLERKPHAMTLPVCSRTGDVVEPRLKSQWYLNCSSMVELAVKVVQDGKLTFDPEYHSKLWFEWFKNSQDWCISRQLWWGHQIPAYLVSHHSCRQDEEFWVAAQNQEEAIVKAAKLLDVPADSVSVQQDEDVLDTWFSSALFPLTALRWPSNTDDFGRFYPLSMMETGFDILFFWVSRMVMLGHHLSGRLPFEKVLLHGMVCDSYGRKMTKSLGNIIDPFDIIHGISLDKLCERAEKSFKQGSLSPEELKLALKSYKHAYPSGIPECGTDALRFSLLMHDVKNQCINMDVKEIRICRHFCNKIWQGVRLFTKAIQNCPKDSLTPLRVQDFKLEEVNEVDRWILSCLSRMVSNVNQGLEQNEFHVAAFAMRHFWVQSFCDIYLEYVKPSLLTSDDNYRLFLCRVMLTCIETFLRLISPIMPFISEELYQRLSHCTNIRELDTVTMAPYPRANEFSPWRNTVLEADINTVVELCTIARSLKTQHGATKMRPKVTIAVDNENTSAALSRFGPLMATLAQLDTVTFHVTQGQKFFEHHVQDSWVFREHEHGMSVIMEMDEMFDSRKSSESKIEDIRKELTKLSKMMSDGGYRKKAPLSVQEKHLAKKASLESELQKCLTQFGRNELEVKDATSVSKHQS